MLLGTVGKGTGAVIDKGMPAYITLCAFTSAIQNLTCPSCTLIRAASAPPLLPMIVFIDKMELLFHTRISLDRRKGRLLGEIWWDLMIKSTAVNAAAQIAQQQSALHPACRSANSPLRSVPSPFKLMNPAVLFFPILDATFFFLGALRTLLFFFLFDPPPSDEPLIFPTLPPSPTALESALPAGGLDLDGSSCHTRSRIPAYFKLGVEKVSKGVSKRYRVTEHTPVRSSWFLACFGTGQNSCSQKLANCL